jgi:hypothetical protein
LVARLAPSTRPAATTGQESALVFIGVVIIIIGFVAKIVILWTIGIIAVVVGVILALLGTTKYAVGGRRHWF